jgi:hypothetical protein
MEYNLVEVWLRRDPVRWLAGAIAGALACSIALLVASLLAQAAGYEFYFPIKLMGTPLLGASATVTGEFAGVWAGCAVSGLICIFWGVIYAHFIGTNSLAALLPMGLVWGVFSWIFTWNLFLQSFRTIFDARLSSGGAFLVCMAYGLSLSTLAFFDRLLRRT